MKRIIKTIDICSLLFHSMKTYLKTLITNIFYMTIFFMHGLPETKEIWGPLRKLIQTDSIAIELPGLGTPLPQGFTGTKDNYVEWLVKYFKTQSNPIDIVGHDIGALFTMRIISHFDLPIRSWVADVGPIFHPDFEWPERMKQYQKIGLGEKILDESRKIPEEDPKSIFNRLKNTGLPEDIARIISKSYDKTMSECILDFYRSAIPNVAHDWWKEIKPVINSHGLVLLLPDPPEDEQRSIEVAEKLGAKTARLEELNHCWMAEDPELVANVLEKFWKSLD